LDEIWEPRLTPSARSQNAMSDSQMPAEQRAGLPLHYLFAAIPVGRND
jgi:hypothetical protein